LPKFKLPKGVKVGRAKVAVTEKKEITPGSDAYAYARNHYGYGRDD
jgi:hypothetical protein